MERESTATARLADVQRVASRARTDQSARGPARRRAQVESARQRAAKIVEKTPCPFSSTGYVFSFRRAPSIWLRLFSVRHLRELSPHGLQWRSALQVEREQANVHADPRDARQRAESARQRKDNNALFAGPAVARARLIGELGLKCRVRSFQPPSRNVNELSR